MTAIGVTGASGRLGSTMVPYLWERGHVVTKIDRTLPPDLEVDVIFHLAAPVWTNVQAVTGFARFNEQVARWAEVTGGRVINTGSWWQYAGPDAERQSYTRLKDDQQAMFGTTLVPFSIYGTLKSDGRGFMSQLTDHARGSRRLVEASGVGRDWIHARDVCEAYRAALRAPEGVYEVCTGVHYSPAELLRALDGSRVAPHVDVPQATTCHRYPRVPGWAPRINVLDHIRRSTRETAA